MKYEQVDEGEWFDVKKIGHPIKCCDCGMVHDWDFRTVKHGTQTWIQARVIVKQRGKKK